MEEGRCSGQDKIATSRAVRSIEPEANPGGKRRRIPKFGGLQLKGNSPERECGEGDVVIDDQDASQIHVRSELRR